jgi:hypothetical protein
VQDHGSTRQNLRQFCVMRRDFHLYQLNDEEFEGLIVQICTVWLGQGVIPFAPGPDGGRDGKFNGKAECFPSKAKPIEGHCVLQAKHVQAPNKSCSDRDFKRLLKNEEKKIKALVKSGICDHYIIFTNRKLTGGAEKELVASLMKLGVKTAHVIGIEKLHAALEAMAHIRDSLPTIRDETPFRFVPDDLVEVIGAIHDYTQQTRGTTFDSAHDFDSVKIAEKNKINGLSSEYHEQIIIPDSAPHFPRIADFLKNPRNGEFAGLYHDAADELKQKILMHRTRFETFDQVFGYLYEQVQVRRSALRGKRRLVSILLHYMYFNCDIGSKSVPTAGADHAHA